MMSTWIKGQEVLAKQRKEHVFPLKKYIENIDMRKVKKVSGTAVYMTESPVATPPAFVHNLEHNKALHRRVIFVYLGVKNIPHVRADNRVKFKRLADGFYLVLVRYGFMDRTDLRAVMRILQNKHLKIDIDDTSFFIESDTLLPRQSVGMSLWRDRLYLLMRRNSERATKYFNIPPERVLEIGEQIKF